MTYQVLQWLVIFSENRQLHNLKIRSQSKKKGCWAFFTFSVFFPPSHQVSMYCSGVTCQIWKKAQMKIRSASLRRSISDKRYLQDTTVSSLHSLDYGLFWIFFSLLAHQSLNNTGNLENNPKKRKISPSSFIVACLGLLHLPDVYLLTRDTSWLDLEMRTEGVFTKVWPWFVFTFRSHNP